MPSLVDWLKSHGNESVSSLTVTIKGTTYIGARYTQTLETPKGSQAHARGERKYQRTMIYCIGRLPACYRRSTRVAFKFAGDARDWYIAGYMPTANLTKENSKYHPFGETFMLAPWDLSNGDTIDRYEPRTRDRVPVTLNSPSR